MKFAVAQAAALGLIYASCAEAIVNSTITAAGLFGSHFSTIDVPASYDYVVVGGGTAGLTIARRLAEHHTVAVIEAGSFYEISNTNMTDIPADASFYLGKDPLYHNPLLDWQQITTPQPGFKGVKTLYPSGHTLGGGSTRNFMWYQRGSTGSYQKWADAVGDDSYEFKNFEPYFKKSVHFSPPPSGRAKNATPKYDSKAFDSAGGPLQVGYPVFASPAATWIAKGLEHIGLKHVDGMENGNLFGWTWISHTIDSSQKRSTSENSFLRDAIENTLSLQVYTNTLAKKIIFDDDKKATGVEVETAGAGSGSVAYTIKANKEVILSSGAFRSPQLLLVSGVGPAATLLANGIETVADRPGVGQNMWDHLFFGPAYAVNTVTHGWLADASYSAEASAQYLEDRTGILTNVGGDLLAFQNLPNGSISAQTAKDLEQEFGSDWPHIEILSLDAYTGALNDFMFGAPRADNFTSICIATVSPFSRGSVTISSSNTKDHPVVNPAWLTDPRDQEIAVAAFKQARAAWEAPALKPILKGPEAFPGKNVTTDEDILNVIQTSSSTIHHAACTNKMGKKDDPLAVVDSHARVIGVQNLRVVDASAFPILPPGHPQATIYAFAEKIADLILTEDK